MGRLRRWHARLWISVRGRATVLTLLVAAVVLGVALTLVSILITQLVRQQVYRETAETASRVAAEADAGRLPDPIPVRRPRVRWVQVVDASGRVLAASRDARGRPPLVTRPADLILNDYTRCPPDLGSCVTVRGVHLIESSYGPDVMVYAAARVPGLRSHWPVFASMAVLYVLALALIGRWVWWLIGTALRPVEAIRADMARFSTDHPGRRVPVLYSGGGEIQRLAETVNATLERLDEANDRQRRFISDASHDLRQPIAAVIAELDLALQDLPDGEARSGVEAALRQAERLNEIVADLLELSRLASGAPAPVERLDLADLVRQELSDRHGRVPITCRLEPGATVRVNRIRLARLLGNLVNNALRHAGTAVEVTVRTDDGTAVLEVADDGAGVPEDLRDKIFERYARGPDSRSRDPGGTGLGLSIAREIAQTYGGSLTLAGGAPGGARFVVRLPADPPPGPSRSGSVAHRAS
ncbi:HAMP domain-containing sensor histidine kinase [Actinomadura kijaniata]|uniref:histidine kinase n=1 Tax=Actinomadura namibiensis TaxID=182080 RepID=A0A7W3LIP5_ACTNM|nr:HAMP domain-containing sensor histidine kinase [Actinomadura namibiensis]MBA8948815.1 signal transduction histidine kinase [Actinomadura namibiensis]